MWTSHLGRIGAAALWTCLTALTLSAQAVRGVVLHPDGVSPAAGVIVVIEDSSGGVIGRVLSDGRGEFRMTLAAAGTYRARLLRIGYQPTLSPPILVEASGFTAVRVVLTGVAVSLPTVAVRGQDICRGQRGDGAQVAAVWEEARKALMASGLSDATAPLVAEWIEYERTLDPTARFVRDQRVRSTRSATTHAFRSAPWSELAERGYVIDTDEGTVFHAPDADVLLSDSFASLHCFHVEPPGPNRANQIGVGFRPASERRRISDIEGTFWIDRASSELRSLEYRYTNLPAITERVIPGGEVEFLRLASGSWLVNRWSIRMPQLVATTPTTMRRRSITVTASTRAIQAVRIVGGEVTHVQRADSVLYRARGASLSIRVSAPDAQIAVADTRITVDGSDYATLTDRDGRARLSAILPGQYQLRAQSPLMDSLGVTADAVDVVVQPAESRDVTIALPSALTLWRRVCGETADPERGAHVRGVTVDTLGLPVADAVVRLTWQQQIAIVSDRLMWSDQAVATRSDSVGIWEVCGVPRDRGITLRAASDSTDGRGALRIADGALFGSARLVLVPSTGVAGVREASVVIQVLDSASRAVRDVQVAFTAAGVTQRLRTDSLGRVRVSHVLPGSVTVEVRKVGLMSGRVDTDVEAGENTIPVVLRGSRVPQLSTVRIRGDRPVNARHEEFERRRERGDATASMGADEIARRAPVSTWQLLTRMPSLLVVDSLGQVFARTSRMSTYICWPRVAIDGLIQPERPNLANLPPPGDIHGIEVFAGPARLPLSFAGEGEQRFCGLIAIWTK